MQKNFLATLALIVATCLTQATAAIQLPPLVADNMVLQRETQITLWGEASPNTKVSIQCEWSKKQLTTQTNAEGDWSIAAQTPEAGGPYRITIKTNKEKVELQNVLIGDVWFCSGQSNMEMPLKGFLNQPTNGSSAEIMNASQLKNLRLFTVPKQASDKITKDCLGEWEICAPHSAANASAVAYFFGKQLTNALDIPIGLIMSSWGGSSILAWMPDECAEKALGTEVNEAFRKRAKATQHKHALLYNSMVAPATRYQIKGFLWYQGENNRQHPKEYIALKKEMIAHWRHLWGDTDNQLGFYFAQIAPYAYGKADDTTLPYFVEAQQACETVIPHCHLAATTDVGDRTCIHPPYKREVGERLAALALEHTYKVEGMTTGEYPKIEKIAFNSHSAVVTMDITNGGINYGTISGFELAGEDKIFHPATAVSQKGAITVKSERISKPVAVRYAFRNYVENNLKSIYGVPSPSFRSDNWEK